MSTNNILHILSAFILTIAFILMMGCHHEKAEDDIFKTGDEVEPPHGCKVLRQRGGEC